MQRLGASEALPMRTFAFRNAVALLIIIFSFQQARFSLAHRAHRANDITVRAFATLIAANVALIVLARINANQRRRAGFAMLPGALRDRTLIIFATATVGFGHTGRFFAAGAAIVVIRPVLGQRVRFAFTSAIFAVARFADTNISFTIADLVEICRALTIRIKRKFRFRIHTG